MTRILKEGIKQEVSIPLGTVTLRGNLVVPDKAQSLVLFLHGSGSGRFSPRNQYVAKILQEAGFGTLLFDLLTKEEEEKDVFTREWRFDIPLLAARAEKVTGWFARQPALENFSFGYFGASTGAAAALMAAAALPDQVKAVVSRGGRPDLAGSALYRVKSPTMLIVGGADPEVENLNREALNCLRCEKVLAIVPGAGHLFEGAGELERVAQLAACWFSQHLD